MIRNYEKCPKGCRVVCRYEINIYIVYTSVRVDFLYCLVFYFSENYKYTNKILFYFVITNFENIELKTKQAKIRRVKMHV